VKTHSASQNTFCKTFVVPALSVVTSAGVTVIDPAPAVATVHSREFAALPRTSITSLTAYKPNPLPLSAIVPGDVKEIVVA
jgi:hypothetical protein